MPEPYLSIIIPAYNEAHRLLPTLEQVDSFIRKQPFPVEAIIVDDGSKDDTYNIALNFIAGREHFKLLKLQTNQGKGAAIKKGMLVASGAFRLFSDADLSTPLEETHKFITLLEPRPDASASATSAIRDAAPTADTAATPRAAPAASPGNIQIVIGSRRLKGARIGIRQPVYRELAGRVFSLLVRLFLLQGFLDTQCGFKMFTAEAARNVFPMLTINRFGFDIEMLFVARKVFGYKIKEEPVAWFDSPASKVSLAKDSLQMFIDIFRVRLNWLKGIYRPS